MPSEKIKILHFVHSLNEGGIERLLLEICRKINRDKFEIQICCLYEKGIIAELFVKEGVMIHSLQAERNFSTVNVFRNISVLFHHRLIGQNRKCRLTPTLYYPTRAPQRSSPDNWSEHFLQMFHDGPVFDSPASDDDFIDSPFDPSPCSADGLRSPPGTGGQKIVD